jgi:CSLREA domain-containing protein
MSRAFKNHFSYFWAVVLIVLISATAGLALLVTQEQPADAATTLTVNSTGDGVDSNPGDGNCDVADGECTLRAAIQESNALAGLDTIEFDIPALDTGVKTIQPASDFDIITDQVIIDGYTQDTATPNTAVSPNPLNGTLLVEIDGTNATNGFHFAGQAAGGAGSTIQGLVINNFSGSAIMLDAQNVNVFGNYIGTDPNGVVGEGNQVGVNNTGAGNPGFSAGAQIGGLLPEQRNIISGNDNGSAAAGMYPADDWVIQGNYIGVDIFGNGVLSNATVGGSGGLSIDFCDGVIVGGSAPGAANVISGNLSHGLAPDNATNLLIEGNFIGTDYTGTIAIGNGVGGSGAGIATRQVTGSIIDNIIADSAGDGIYLNDVQDLVIQGNHIGTGIVGDEVFGNDQAGILMTDGSANNIIGGSGAGEGNIIANNAQAGIQVWDNTSGSTNNTIIGNSIFNNGDLGIELNPLSGVTENDPGDADAGANDLLNFPENMEYEDDGTDTTIYFDLDVPAGDYRIEFFNVIAPDPSGNGEGDTFLGSVDVTSAGTGIESFSHTLTGQTGMFYFSATATEILPLATTGFGSTSEFSELALEVVPPEPVYTSSATKTLLNPELVAVDADIVFRLTITNDGPDSFNLTDRSGSNPGGNSLFFDVLPPELTYVSQDNPDVTCVDFAEASIFGPALGNHSTHRLINCGYSGAGQVLDEGESFSIDMDSSC